MEKRLELERRGRSPSQITDLNLDNARSATIVGLLDDYCNLESLSLINVGLTNLKGFPSLPKLKRLELSENRISSGLNYLKNCPNLQILNLCGNKITEFEVLEPLKDFEILENLDLFNCEITQIENYREKVFNLIPSLKYLDGFDRDDKEAKDASEMDEEIDDEEEEEIEDEEIDDDEVDEEEVDDEEVDDEEADDDDDEEEEEEEEGVGLSALIGDIDEEEDNEENFQPNGDHASDDDDIDDDADESVVSKDKSDDHQRGQKRKHVDDEEKE